MATNSTQPPIAATKLTVKPPADELPNLVLDCAHVEALDRELHPMILTGRLAARYKELVLTSAVWLSADPGRISKVADTFNPPTTRVRVNPARVATVAGRGRSGR